MNTFPPEQFGSTLRFMRKVFDLSVDDLARSSTVSVACIYALQAGSYQPSLDTVRKLADAFGLTLLQLMTVVEHLPPVEPEDPNSFLRQLGCLPLKPVALAAALQGDS
jgi:predicted transcriptional regulator